MNKYRLIDLLDEYMIFACLSCKANFIQDAVVAYCPFCGIKFEGGFDVHHKRYSSKYDYPKPTYELDDNGDIYFCHKSHLILEKRTLMDKELAKDGFYINFLHRPKWTKWYLMCHCDLGVMCSSDGLSGKEEISSSVCMMRTYNRDLKTLKPNEELRLVLMIGKDRKIIKQMTIEDVKG